MILEKAYVEYEKGEYKYTIESEYSEFENLEEMKKYIYNNLEKDVEYYMYYNQEDVENNNHIDCIICNKELKIKAKFVKKYWNDNKIEIYEKDGRFIALNGWNGYEYTDCFELEENCIDIIKDNLTFSVIEDEDGNIIDLDEEDY